MTIYNSNHSCPFCHSVRIIKHGKTSTDNQRFRCRYCKRTWVQSRIDREEPDFGSLTEAYLGGYSYRDLRAIYPNSPTRINQKIREYLVGCPPWEEYCDTTVVKHEARLIHLVGTKFNCTSKDSDENCMFLAMAIDALSTVVLGFEIGKKDSKEVWVKLLDRMNCRGIICPSYMSYGSKAIEDAIAIVFPYASVFNNFTRAHYDKKLKSKLNYSLDSRELMIEAMNAFEYNETHQLENYLTVFKDKKMKNLVLTSPELFISRLQERIELKYKTRFEGLLGAFRHRFEKFHMLKFNPYPIINGWIAWWMLIPLPVGFSRFSLYLQKPCKTYFKNFNCGTIPIECNLDIDSPEMKAFTIELAVRSLHIPIK